MTPLQSHRTNILAIRTRMLVATLSFLMPSLALAAPPAIYDFSPAGARSFGAAVNDAGQVAGTAAAVAIRYDHTPGGSGDIHFLGDFGNDSIGMAINNAGRVAGYSASSDGSLTQAFRFEGTPGNGGSMYILGALNNLSGFSSASGINDAGQVAGSSTIAGPQSAFHAFRYDDAPHFMRDLGTLGGSNSYGTGINNAGQVAGYSQISGDTTNRAFRYDGTPGAGGVMRNLGTLGGSNSRGNGINEAGQVVGSSQVTGNAAYHAFRYDGTPGAGGVMRDLGTLGGSNSGGIAINDAGHVVGTSQITGNTAAHAFLYIGTPGAGGQMIDLDVWLDAHLPTEAAKWTLVGVGVAPSDISNTGWITGTAIYDPDGPGGVAEEFRAYLIDASSLVPEPSGPALLAFAVPALLRRRPQSRQRQAIRRACSEVLEGRRLLSFSAPTTYPLESSAAAVLSADFNHDGRRDLATVYQSVNVLLGDGQGGFGAPSQFGSEDHSWTGVTADFNNDGHADLATLNNDRSVSVWRGNGDGTFQPAVRTTLAPWGTMHSMAAADFNGDGKMDLVYSAEESQTEWGSVEVLLGDGQGAFPTRHLYQLNKKNPNGLAVADLNADGRPDVVTTNFGNHDGFVSVLLGNGDGTLSYNVNSSNFTTGLFPVDVVVGDFTSDGTPDLATISDAAGASLSVLPGRGDGTFAAQIGTSAHVGNSLAAADFNGDGRLDIFMAPVADDLTYPGKLFLGHGNGTFQFPEDVEMGGDSTCRAVARDFNGDGHPDLAVGVTDYTTAGLTVLLNDGVWGAVPPSLRISDATVTEGNTGSATATFTVSLSRAADVDVTVQYSTANLTATAGSDYVAKTGTLTIPAGQTSTTVAVTILGDRIAEPAEIFCVNLISADHATIDDAQGIGTIADDEPRISIKNVSQYEGNAKTTPFTFTLTLSAAYDQAVTVKYATANGTATAGSDYQAKSGSVTFAPGETVKTITVVVLADKSKESNETFFVDLFGASGNSLIGASRGTGTILDDDNRR